MIIIKRSEIKKFISAAKPVRDTKLIPIYGYVKLDCTSGESVFYKSNGQAFVKCKVESDFKEKKVYLIEEQTLFGFVDHGTSEFITIRQEGDKIFLSDEKNRNTSCQSVSDTYTSHSKEDGVEKIELDSDIISALFIAKSHTKVSVDKGMKMWMCYTHVKQSGKLFYVVGFDGMVCYTKGFKNKLPTISLGPETVAVLSKFTSVTYSQDGNFDYFDGGGISYGFAKTENPCPDITPVLDRMKPKESILIDRRKAIEFCEFVISICTSSLAPVICMKDDDGGGVIMTFTDTSSNKYAEDKVPAVKKKIKIRESNFLPKNMITVLKELPGDEVKICFQDNQIIITCDEEKTYMGAIMEVALQTK